MEFMIPARWGCCEGGFSDAEIFPVHNFLHVGYSRPWKTPSSEHARDIIDTAQARMCLSGVTICWTGAVGREIGSCDRALAVSG